jgi:molybdopterin molybdotransferase
MRRPIRPVIGVEEAREWIMALASVVRESEEVDLPRAHHRVTSSPTFAKMSLPPFDRSAVDGFGIAEPDIARATPFSLELVGRVVADEKRPSQTLQGGETMKLATGAPIPEGVQAIIMEEHCETDGTKVSVLQRVKFLSNMRLGGEDVRAGDIIVEGGESVDARHIAMLAAAGVSRVQVRRRLRVSVLSTGDELQDGGSELTCGMIYDSNRPMLAAMLANSFIQFGDCGRHGDSPATWHVSCQRLPRHQI